MAPGLTSSGGKMDDVSEDTIGFYIINSGALWRRKVACFSYWSY